MGKQPVNSAPLVCDVCLVGGGHSHVLLIRRWAMNPLPGVRLTLVSTAATSPYSGMLPGLIAGHYAVDDIHVDLLNLCSWAGVRFIEDTVTAIDLTARCIGLESQRPDLAFDVLSLDTGSTPDLSVEGSSQHVTPVKPVYSFYERWQAIRERLQQSAETRVAIGVVGSGAGGFELATAMRHNLSIHRASVHWFLRGEAPLGGRPAKVGQLALEAAKRNGVNVVSGFDVVRVEAGKLIAADRRQFEVDEILWCTAATGPAWPKAAGLAVDKRGFVSTNAYLQSTSHDFVFATGDIGTQVETPSAKAGVFAVRQAPFLFDNIRRYILGEALKPYKPQSDFLSIMATGGKQAIASRGPLAIEGDWVWRWKNHIDQSFMRQFKTLPIMNQNASLNRLPDALKQRYFPMKMSDTVSSQFDMQCRGCGSKVGEQVLEKVLAAIAMSPIATQSREYSPAGDTAVIDLQGGTLVQSVDHINAIVDDPYWLGRIAVLHALSDVVTVDARVHSAQLIVTVPRGTAEMVERELTQLMKGAVEALSEEHCALVGGHTVEGNELSVGVVVNAILNEPASSNQTPEQIERAVLSGDALILTQPLGIGTLFAGLMQGKARGGDMAAALMHMGQSNRAAADILRMAGSRYMTDVTGFGLLGHLERLLRGLSVGASVHSSRVPLLPGALELATQGIRSSLWPNNRHVLAACCNDTALTDARLASLCDPQTSGGLLAIVPGGKEADCIRALHSAGYLGASIIGTIDTTPKLSLH